MPDHAVASQPVVLALPGMRDVTLRAGLPYATGRNGPLAMDLYVPQLAAAGPLPAVVFVTGYADSGALEVFGRKLKDVAAYQSWARLVACRGMVGITYESDEPARSAPLLLAHLEAEAATLGIDPTRLGIWSCSGNVPNALAVLADHPALAAAALCYRYTLDLDGRSEVADAAGAFGFVNPLAGRSIAELPPVPMLVARAGRDEMPGLNASLDGFVAAALAANLPVSVVNHPTGPHAFDIFDESADSRATLRLILSYLETRLAA